LTEIRCVKCKRLLMKAEYEKDRNINVKVEIKCPKCGYVNKFTITDLLVEFFKNEWIFLPTTDLE